MVQTAEIVQFQKKQESAFVCVKCGADRDCDCNAPGMKRKRVEEYLMQHPDASTRTAAADLGVSNSTVHEARAGVRDRTPDNHLPPEIITGRDGKKYKTTRRPETFGNDKEDDNSAGHLAQFRTACRHHLPHLNASDMKDAIDYFRQHSGYF